MTAKMHSFFEKRKWNDKRDTPQASLAPCRLHFLMFSALHAEKAALLRRKNAFGRTTALLAPRMPSQNKKAIPYGMTFCFGGDKRDRTADLMTASHALSQLSYTPIGESYSNRFRRKMQVFSRENLKITAMTENTVRASAFWQKNRVRFCENGVCQTARICDKIQKTAIGCWQNACFRYDVPKQDQRRKEDCT